MHSGSARARARWLAQTFAAVWTWIKAKLPSYRRPVVEITINTTLDGTIHNGAILVCSQPVTLTPAFVEHGQRLHLQRGQRFGRQCHLRHRHHHVNRFARLLAAGQAAELRAFSYAGGNVVFAGIAGGAPVQPPGQVTGLAIGVTMPSSIALSWQAPGTGGAATGYTVNYRVTSVGGAWTAQGATGTSLTVIGLAAATQYDFEVIATNAAGSGVASSIVTGTTQAAPTQAPGQVTGAHGQRSALSARSICRGPRPALAVQWQATRRSIV